MTQRVDVYCFDCEEGDHDACDANEPEFWCDSGICDCRNSNHRRPK